MYLPKKIKLILEVKLIFETREESIVFHHNKCQPPCWKNGRSHISLLTIDYESMKIWSKHTLIFLEAKEKGSYLLTNDATNSSPKPSYQLVRCTTDKHMWYIHWRISHVTNMIVWCYKKIDINFVVIKLIIIYTDLLI